MVTDDTIILSEWLDSCLKYEVYICVKVARLIIESSGSNDACGYVTDNVPDINRRKFP